jgi:DNA polymerase-4
VHRAILHVDMDAFYASVEQRDNPALRGKPVIVGGHPTRGVVLAASYEVRPFGVRSAMPMAQAVKLAPQALVVPPRFEAYAKASEGAFAIFERYTPAIEPLSLDEAFLDVTASLRLFGPAAAVARRIRAEVAAELSVPASAGIAENKFVAKIATDLAKPDGQREVPFGQARAFLAPLPVSRLWGVGAKTEAVLWRWGLRRIGDVAEKDPTWLEQRVGAWGRALWHLSRGEDERPVVPDRLAKSIGAEETFEEDLVGLEALRPHLHAQALRVGRRLRRAGVRARVAQLKVKHHDFEVLTRRRTLPSPTDDGQALYQAALALLARVDVEKPIRLTGVSAQELVGEGAQLGLFEEPPARRQRLNAALDKIADRFGTGAVVPADLAGDDEA